MTKKENWNPISSEEKNLFTHTESVEDDVQVASVQEEDHLAKAEVIAEEPAMVMPDDDDVRVIGYGDMNLVDGRSVVVEEFGIDGQHVAVIDVDKERIDVHEISDVYQSHHSEGSGVIDLDTGFAISFPNDPTGMDDMVADVDLNTIPV